MWLTEKGHRPLQSCLKQGQLSAGRGSSHDGPQNHDTDRLEYLAWSNKYHTLEINVNRYISVQSATRIPDGEDLAVKKKNKNEPKNSMRLWTCHKAQCLGQETPQLTSRSQDHSIFWGEKPNDKIIYEDNPIFRKAGVKAFLIAPL